MAGRRRTKRSGRPDGNRTNNIRLGIVLAAVIAVAVIAAVVIGKRQTPEESEGLIISQDSSGETEDADNNVYTTDVSDDELQKDSVPQVNQIISEYFQAKVDQDAETLYRLFGKTDTSGIDQQKRLLRAEAAYIEDYEDIVCYTKPGLTEDSYVVYVTYKVKFRRVNTLAPGLMWCYVLKDESGSYIIRENVLGDEADYVAKQTQTEDVQLLQKQVNEQLRQALESDPILAGFYQDLQGGAVVDDSEESEEASDSAVELVE